MLLGLREKKKGTGQNRGYTPCHGTVAGGRKVLQERIRYRPCGLRGFRDGGCEKEIQVLLLKRYAEERKYRE